MNKLYDKFLSIYALNCLFLNQAKSSYGIIYLMKPNCTKCKHYFITFDQLSPKGCRVYQIKSSQLPSVIVKQANGGADCVGFELKDRLKEKSKNKYE